MLSINVLTIREGGGDRGFKKSENYRIYLKKIYYFCL